MLEQLYYYNFKDNLSEGTYLKDGALINRKISVNKDFYLNWSGVTNYGEVDIGDENTSVTMKVNKPSQLQRNINHISRDLIDLEEELDVNYLTEVNTHLLSKNGVQKYTDYIEMLIDWQAVDLPEEDTGEIKIVTDNDEYFMLRLFNKSKIEFVFFDGNDEFTTENITTHPDSTANISHLFRNDIKQLKLKVKLTDDGSGGYDINVQISSMGIKSEWITRNFSDTKLTKIISYLPYDSKHTAKKLKLYNFHIDGFYSNETYNTATETIELEGKVNDINNILLDGEVLNEIPFNNNNNMPILKIDVADNEEDLNINNGRSFNIGDADGEFTITGEITEEYLGKYLMFSITNSPTNSYQNLINYLLVDYEIKEETTYDFPEIQVSKNIDVSGGVIEIDDIFNSKLFIPENAITTDTEITITRLASDDNRVPPNSIAYYFQPEGLNFNEDLLFTLDYTGFNFDYYSSEEGLSVIYVKNSNPDDSEEMDSIVYKEKNKLISYISHFSTYMVRTKDNLYTSRTKYHAEEYPDWMELNNKDSNYQQFDNYSLNIEMDNFYDKKNYAQQQLFIDKADTSQRFISFIVEPKHFYTKSNNKLDTKLNEDTYAEYKGKIYNIVFDQVDFFTRYDNVLYYDRDKELLHFPRRLGKNLKIYHENSYHYIDEEVKLTENHIWNSFDELGLLMGIERFPLESNENFKERILNVRSHRHGADKEGLKNAVKNLTLGVSDRLNDEQKELISQI